MFVEIFLFRGNLNIKFKQCLMLLRGICRNPVKPRAVNYFRKNSILDVSLGILTYLLLIFIVEDQITKKLLFQKQWCI